MYYMRRQPQRKIATPYGAAGRNGLNFVKSVHDPDSRLALVVQHLQLVGFAPKGDLVRLLAPESAAWVKVRGWGSVFFATARKSGFLTYKHGLWSPGPKAKRVVTWQKLLLKHGVKAMASR